MATIQLKNIGPIKDTGPIPITRVMLFLGSQGVGKSTLVKILCYCRWVEKQVVLDKKQISDFTHYKRFIKRLMDFYRLDSVFFSSQSLITYQGDFFDIIWRGPSGNAQITRRPTTKESNYNPKISFVPAERNLASAIENVEQNYKGNLSRDLLFNFIWELRSARTKYDLSSPLLLSIDSGVRYYHSNGKDMIKLEKQNKAISTYFASSGIQSAFPIDVIASYLFDQIGETPKMSVDDLLRLFADKETSPKDAQEIFDAIRYSSMQLYLEEPEQNLFPESQRKLLLRLLELMRRSKYKEEGGESSLVITTHSPYLLSVLNTQIALVRVRRDLDNRDDLSEDEKEKRRSRLKDLDPLEGKIPLLDIEEYSAYFIDKEGGVKSLMDDPEFPMVSGSELDGVSDWVDELIDEANRIVYLD